MHCGSGSVLIRLARNRLFLYQFSALAQNAVSRRTNNHALAKRFTPNFVVVAAWIDLLKRDGKPLPARNSNEDH